MSQVTLTGGNLKHQELRGLRLPGRMEFSGLLAGLMLNSRLNTQHLLSQGLAGPKNSPDSVHKVNDR